MRLSQLSGEAATGGQQVAFQMGNQFLGMMLDPFVDGRNGAAGAGGPAIAFAPEREDLPDEIALAYSAVLKAPPVKTPSFEQRWSVWGGAYGGSNRTSGDPAVLGSHDLSAAHGGISPAASTIASRPTPSWASRLPAAAPTGASRTVSAAARAMRSRPASTARRVRARPISRRRFAFTNHWMSTDRFAFAGDHLTASFNAQ